MLVKGPVPLAIVVRVGRAKGHIGAGSIGVVFLRPRGNVKCGRKVGLNFEPIGGRHSPFLVLSPSTIKVLVGATSIGFYGSITIAKRINEGPVRGGKGSQLIALVCGVFGPYEISGATYYAMVTHCLVPPETIGKRLYGKRGLGVHMSLLFSMKGGLIYRFPVNWGTTIKINFPQDGIRLMGVCELVM